MRELNETLEQRVQAATRERLQIWDVSQDLLVIAGLDGTYLSVNPAWTATLGWSEADLLGKSSQWLLHPDDREKTRAELDHLFKGHKTVRFENRLRAKDGSYHWISWKAAPDSERISVGRDITESKRAQDALNRAGAELARVSRVTALSVIALSSNDLQRNRIVLQSELADDLPVVTGDRIQLQQVILNLLRNASDAMADVHDRPRELVIKTEREESDGVRLTVRSGVGLSSQSLDSLFDPFYTTKSGGMGIGLFVSRSIIERHHGRLWGSRTKGRRAPHSRSPFRAET